MLTVIVAVASFILAAAVHCGLRAALELRRTKTKQDATRRRIKLTWLKDFGIEAIWAAIIGLLVGIVAALAIGATAPTTSVQVDARQLVPLPGYPNGQTRYLRTCDEKDYTIYGFYQQYGVNGRHYDYLTSHHTVRLSEGDGGNATVDTYEQRIDPSWRPWSLLDFFGWDTRGQSYEIRVPKDTIDHGSSCPAIDEAK
jgi:hypothetical protein